MSTAAAPQLRGNPVPVGNPLQGGLRRYVLSELLLRNEATAHAYSTLSSRFEIWHPSTRLHACMTIGFMPDTSEDATIPATWSWGMDAWGKTSRERFGGRRVRGNQIIPGACALPTTLPASYEAITGVDQWIGSVTVPSGGTGLAVAGSLIISVSWEPAAGDNISDEALARIFETCKLFGGNGATVYNSVG
jgi:hypothetical protein